MSLEQVAAAAQGVVHRARALFASSPQWPAVAPLLHSAAQTLTASGARAAGLSGEIAERYRRFGSQAGRRLQRNGDSDRALRQQVVAAATVTEQGAHRLDAIAAQTGVLAAAAASVRTPAAQRAVLVGLRAQVASADSVVSGAQQQSSLLAAQIGALRYDSAGRAREAGFGQHLPQSPSPTDPAPHGMDRRYWVDVTRIIRVPPGQKAPYGTKRIGPDLWYPVEDGGMSGPPPAHWPLDLSTLTRVAPGQPGPYGTTELAPGIFAPDPRRVFGAAPSWPVPQLPIDVRDVIEVPPGQQAPWDYVEYLPGWWAPRVPNGPH